jgi:site-specific recombinase XerD
MESRKPLKIPEVLTEEERVRLLTESNPKALIGLRNLCMLRLMADAGLRLSEVLNLEERDINWNSGQLKVRQGKGKKDRFLWVSPGDLGILEDWRKKKPANSRLFFTTRRGDRICDVYVWQAVKRLTRKAGIDKNIHPHSLRHTFATDLYRNTKNIALVQKALGHSDISTTMIYTHIVDDELMDAMKNFRLSDSAGGAAELVG